MMIPLLTLCSSLAMAQTPPPNAFKAQSIGFHSAATGDLSDLAGGDTYIVDMNNDGTVIGYAHQRDSAGNAQGWRPFVLRPRGGQYHSGGPSADQFDVNTWITLIGDTSTRVYAINDRGIIIGRGDVGGTSRGLKWTPDGTIEDVPDDQMRDIDGRGHVLGRRCDPNGASCYPSVDGDRLGNPISRDSGDKAWRMNNHGDVIGGDGQTAFLYRFGLKERFSEYAFADAISDRGDIYLRNTEWEVFHVRNGVAKRIRRPGFDGCYLGLRDANAKGQAVGYCGARPFHESTPPWGAWSATPISEIYLPDDAYGAPAGVYTLGSLIDDNNNILGAEEAIAINDHGMMAGTSWSWNWTSSTGWVAIPTGYVPPDVSAFDAVYSAADAYFAGESGDPVNTLTGEFVYRPDPDLALAGPDRLTFSRYYASNLEVAGVSGTIAPNWRHNWEWDLVLSDDGELATVVDPRGGRHRFAWDATNSVWTSIGAMSGFQLVSDAAEAHFHDPTRGVSVRFDIVDEPHAIDLISREGDEISLLYDVNDALVGVQDRFGRTLTLSYSSDGQLASVGDGVRTVQFGHDADGRLNAVTDAGGRITEYHWSTDTNLGHLLDAIVLPGGETLVELDWDAEGRVVWQADGLGEASTFVYGDTSTVTDRPDGTSVTHHYDQDRLVRMEDSTGRDRALAYEATGRRESVDDDSRGTTRAHDDLSGALASETTGAGTTTWAHQSRTLHGIVLRDLVGRTFPDGTSETLDWDGDGRLLSHSDRRGEAVTYTWNNDGLLTEESLPGGATHTHVYDSLGRKIETTGPFGHTTTWTWDGADRITDVTWPDGSGMSYVYADDRLVETIDELGASTEMRYDANGRLSEKVDALGNVTRFTYHPSGWLTAMTTATGGVLSFTYDGLGRLVEERDATGAVVETQWDARDLPVRTIDELGATWETTYDDAMQVTSETDPLGRTWTYTWDAGGRLEDTIGPDGEGVSRVWDAMGRLTQVTARDGRVTTYTYDVAGDIASVKAPGGLTASVRRNKLGAITQVTGPYGEVWRHGRDIGGRPTSVTDPDGNETTYTYDSRGRVKRYDFPDATCRMTWDDAGRLVGRSCSDGTTASFTRDAVGRVTSFDGGRLSYDGNGDLIGSNGLILERDLAGRVVSIDYGGGRTVEYAYDPRGYLIAVSDWLGNTLDITYDEAGQRTSLARSNGIETTWSYDDVGRVIGIDEDKGRNSLASLSLERDVAGRILSAERDVPLPRSANQYSLDVPEVGKPIHDARGRRVADGSRTFTWNDATWLLGVDADDGSLAFAYDGFGVATQRTAGVQTETRIWSYDTPEPTVAVTVRGGQDARYDVFTPGGELLYLIDAVKEQAYFPHFDETGTTGFVTDHRGRIVARYAYGPYGEVLSEEGDVDNPYRWQGRFGALSEGHGLVRLGERVYDSASGRFLSREPLPDTLHPLLLDPHQYAANDPMTYNDATGRKPLDFFTSQYMPSKKKLAYGGGRVDSTYSTVMDTRSNADWGNKIRLQHQATEGLKGAVGPNGRPTVASQRAVSGFTQGKKIERWSGSHGNKLAVLDAALTAYKFREKVHAEHAHHTNVLAANASARDRLVAEIHRLRKGGYMTQAEAERALRFAFSGYDTMNEAATKDARTSIFAHSYSDAVGAVAGLIPPLKAGLQKVGFIQ